MVINRLEGIHRTSILQHMPAARRRVPFPDRTAARGFNDTFRETVNEALRQAVEEMIAPENQHAFYHGRGWTQRRPDGSEMTGEVEAHTAETTLAFKDVVTARFSALPDQISSIVSQMRDGFMATMYARVSEGVERVGNVVNAKGKDPMGAFLEMLRKIEFGVNRQGEVTRPQIHPPEAAQRFAKAMENASSELREEVARLIAEKDVEALAREKERLARFKERPADG
jgi:hypothetical protein